MTPSLPPVPVPIEGALTGSSAEWFAATAAFVALVISLGAVYYTRRSERRQLFIHLHDLLTSLESQAGRRILFSKMKTSADIERIFENKPEDFDKVNRALGLYNTLGIYVYRQYVEKDEALAHWGGPIQQNWSTIDRFLKWRRGQTDDVAKWPYLMWLARECDAPISAIDADKIDENVASSKS